MKLSELQQFDGVEYTVRKGQLLASCPDFCITVEGKPGNWYIHVVVDDDGRKSGEYGITVHWSRNVVIAMMYSCIMYCLGKGNFPPQLKEFRI